MPSRKPVLQQCRLTRSWSASTTSTTPFLSSYAGRNTKYLGRSIWSSNSFTVTSNLRSEFHLGKLPENHLDTASTRLCLTVHAQALPICSRTTLHTGFRSRSDASNRHARVSSRRTLTTTSHAKAPLTKSEDVFLIHSRFQDGEGLRQAAAEHVFTYTSGKLTPGNTAQDGNRVESAPLSDGNIWHHDSRNELQWLRTGQNVNLSGTRSSAGYLNFRPTSRQQAHHIPQAVRFGSGIQSSESTEALGRTESQDYISGQPSSSSTLVYQIPDEVLLQIRDVTMNKTPRLWTYSLYKGPNGQSIPVHYCRKIDASERIARLFLGEELLGFDLEWRPNTTSAQGIKNNVSLIQLASADRIALFHVALHNGDTKAQLLAPTLQRIMEDASITKAGVAIKADCSRLRRHFGVESRGLFELSHLYRVVKHPETGIPINRKLVSLAQQVEAEFKMLLFKGDVRGSDWSKELNMEQIMYAASDAYASVRLFHSLDTKRLALSPPPRLPAHAELNLPLPLPPSPSMTSSEESWEDDDSDDDQEDEEEPLADGSQAEMTATPLALNIERLSIVDEQSKASTPDASTAVQWIETWQATLPEERTAQVSHKSMLAYVYWHVQELEPAAFLNAFDRPLRPMTVACYVLDVITKEKMPYDAARLTSLVRHVPYKILRARYGQIPGMQ